MNDTNDHINIYTDGACLGNPGPGGYGAILIYGDHQQELAGGYSETTNNRMEIMAAIRGLEALVNRSKVTLYSDSQYLVNAMTLGWAEKWRKNGWRRNRKQFAINSDLWSILLDLCAYHNVEFRWVRGHAGLKGNEDADRLASGAAKQNNLPPDTGYSSIQP